MTEFSFSAGLNTTVIECMHTTTVAMTIPPHPVWIPSWFYTLSKTFPWTWRFSPFVLADLANVANKI